MKRILLFPSILLLTAISLRPSTAPAAAVVTDYATGDLFIGFRQAGAANTLAVNIGSLTKYLPSTYGGTWNGTPFQVQFGVVPPGNPGAGNPVFSLTPDLAAVFGDTWATNDLADSSTDVSWAVAGQTSNTSANSPVAGLARRSVFETIARTNPNAIADAPLNFSNLDFAIEFNSFAQGTGGGNAFKGRLSTENSSVTYSGAASDGNNWGTRIGPTASTFNSGTLGEQPLSGSASGPTNSILDLYLIPNEGSTLLTSPTYLGSFSLDADGELLYRVVPEPGSLALLGTGAALLGMKRRRGRSKRCG